MDEIAVHTWLSLPPPPTPAEAHDEVQRQLASGDLVDRELVGRALRDPRADERLLHAQPLVSGRVGPEPLQF
jgi:hypothetical protein